MLKKSKRNSKNNQIIHKETSYIRQAKQKIINVLENKRFRFDEQFIDTSNISN